jgi:hypothetical protein
MLIFTIIEIVSLEDLLESAKTFEPLLPLERSSNQRH